MVYCIFLLGGGGFFKPESTRQIRHVGGFFTKEREANQTSNDSYEHEANTATAQKSLPPATRPETTLCG